MPAIAEDDLPLLGSTMKGNGKLDANIDLAPTKEEVSNERTKEKEQRIRQYKNYWLPAIGVLLLFSFFATLVGLMTATGYYGNKYPDIVVTPFSNFNYETFGNYTTSDTTVTQPCYYPVLLEALNDTIHCNIQSATQYYCPKDYACITNTTMFPAPYIGCVSLKNPCGDLQTCVDLIDALPNTVGNAKEIALEFSTPMLLIFTIGGSIFLVVTTVFVISHMIFHSKQVQFHSKQLLIMIGAPLTVTFVFIMVSGGFYFSMDLPHYTYGANCYSSADINYTLDKLTNISFGYLLGYTFTGVAALFYVYLGFSFLLALTHIHKKTAAEEGVPL